MDYLKKDYQQKRRDKYTQYVKEKDFNKRRKLWLEIQIMDLKNKLEKLKKN